MRLSISKLKAFKSCRRLYELKYVERMQPVQKSEALEIGANYHSLLEELYKTGSLPQAEDDWTKELAMATAYQKYIYPSFKVESVEDWFEYDLGDGDVLVGRTDGIAEDGCIVEHKTTGSDITEQYEYNLMWDEQILAYMLVTGSRKVYYTVCRKPTIRLKKDESEREFFNRMVAWYDDETDSKIRLLEIYRTDDEVEAFREELLCSADDILHAKRFQRFYRNTCHCNMWGRRCEYSGICLNYDPNQEYVEFVKGDEYEPTKN